MHVVCLNQLSLIWPQLLSVKPLRQRGIAGASLSLGKGAFRHFSTSEVEIALVRGYINGKVAVPPNKVRVSSVDE